MSLPQQPFSNVQLELLKLFADDVSEEDLIVIKRMLAGYRLRKATAAADAMWDDQQWTATDMERLLHQHERTPYRRGRDETHQP